MQPLGAAGGQTGARPREPTQKGTATSPDSGDRGRCRTCRRRCLSSAVPGGWLGLARITERPCTLPLDTHFVVGDVSLIHRPSPCRPLSLRLSAMLRRRVRIP